MNSNESNFIIFLIVILVIILGVKLARALVVYKHTKKDQEKTRSFYNKVADKVNNKKEK